MDKHLFLFGGGAPFNESLGKKFASLSSIGSNRVAILFNERDGLKHYGVADFVYFPITSYPSQEFIEQTRSSTGIIISGGDTELYRDYIVDTEIGEAVRAVYDSGYPVAGFSAGALISPSVCVIPPIDNRKNEHLFLKGLGLVDDCVISAHFSKWNEEENIKSALSKTNLKVGYGIDDDSGVYLKNGVISQSAGQVYFYYNPTVSKY